MSKTKVGKMRVRERVKEDPKFVSEMEGDYPVMAPPPMALADHSSASTGDSILDLSEGEGPIQMLEIGGQEISPDNQGNNEGVLRNCLEAILFAQLDNPDNPGSWSSLVDKINESLKVGGVDSLTLEEIRKLYESLAELNFNINHILRETWDRCLNATDVAKRGQYASVGGKFQAKFAEMLKQIKTDFPGLESLVDKIASGYVNKEHIINKGKGVGGSETEHSNLMYGGIPQESGRGSLSELHKKLHKMKPGTGKTNNSKVDPSIQQVIEEVISQYDQGTLGEFS